MKRKICPLLAFLLLAIFAAAQQPSGKPFATYHGMQGIKKKLSELKQPAARINVAERFRMREEILQKKKRLGLKLDKLHGRNPTWQQKKQQRVEGDPNSFQRMETELSPADAAPMEEAGAATQEIWSNFLASSFGETPYVTPPDPNGDVGTSQVAVITNGSLKVFEKRGVTDPPLTTTTGTNNKPAPAQFFITLDEFFFPLFRFSTFSTADPRIHFDRLTKRWFVVALELTFNLRGNMVFLAVSDGEKITDQSSFTYYRFPGVLGNPDPSVPLPLVDFPTLGIDRSAVLVGSNNFYYDAANNVDSLYAMSYIVDKRMLLRGRLVVYSALLGRFNLHDGSYGGMYAPQAVHNGDPQFARSYFAGIPFDLGAIFLAAVGYNSTHVPISLTRSAVPTRPWNFPRDITAPGSPMPIDPLDSRLLQATIQKNKRTGKSSLWTAHAVGVNEKGAFVSDEDFVDKARTASRWYEVDNLTTNTPRLIRTGIQYDPTPSGRRATMYFNPSVMANGQGHVALGGTTAAFDKYLNVFVAGRYFGETPGVLHPPVKATNATAMYALVYGNYFSRWGDYSYTVVDPMDDQTLWTFQEYADADDSYGTRAVQLKAPPPATPVSVSTIAGNIDGVFSNKADQDVVIKGMSEKQSGFFDTGNDPGGPGFNRLTVKSTKGVIAGNIRWISPTEIRCRLYTKGKAPGDYQLIITNPDGQFVSINYMIMAESANRIAATTVNREAASRFVVSSAVFPNPTENNLRLVVHLVQDVMTRVVVTDITGKQVSSKVLFLSKGPNTVALSLSAVNRGTYTVAVYNSENVIIAAHRVIKE